jgi:hypothetical protein
MVATPVSSDISPIADFATGIACHTADSLYPERWDKLAGLWFEAAGNTGSELRDMSMWGSHGTLNNSPTWVDGEAGIALRYLESSDQYTSVPHHDHLNIDVNEDFSFAVRIKTPGRGGVQQRVFEKYDPGGANPGYILYINAGHDAVFLIDAGANFQFVTATAFGFDDNIWHTIVVRKKKIDLEIWIDGKLSGFGSHTTWAEGMTNTVDLLFGRGIVADTNYFTGDMSGIAFWKRAISMDEIARPFDLLIPADYPPFFSTSQFIKLSRAYYRQMEED